ncbi:hypothetical protein LOD99_11568 [Oopsacas minuta]|uniref:Uncharacterized protein n=1 Tax=Oopsacas minuta TaxID=111878 RepID=A0AAV7JJV6_9METZ|nr:hypothetical protein LOD99_11568 [Oopsacas minuta]
MPSVPLLISVPYVSSFPKPASEKQVLPSRPPIPKDIIGTKKEQCKPISRYEVEQYETGTNEGENRTETSLENKIKGSTMEFRPQTGTNFRGFGQSKRPQMNQTKKKNITNIISEILGISGTPGCSFNQSDASFASFQTPTICSARDMMIPKLELSTGTNDERKTPDFSSGFQFLSNRKVDSELSVDTYRNKRMKIGTETNSFISGMNLLDSVTKDKECEDKIITSNWFNNDNSLLSIGSDIFSAATESISCLEDFSPVKCFAKPKLNSTYDILPIADPEPTTEQTGTIISNSKPEEYTYEGDILNMTFSDQSNDSNSVAKTESESNLNEIAPIEDENETIENEYGITLTQFLTQVPLSTQENLSSNLHHETLHKNVNILEPSFTSVNTVKFQDDPSIPVFSIETSKDIQSINQSKFELELKELISETETLDSLIFTQPQITGYSLPNQNAPGLIQYSLTDIFSPTQENTSSPKLVRTKLEPNTSQNGTMDQTLTNISFENFDNTTRITFLNDSQSNEKLDTCQRSPLVAMENSQNEAVITEENFNFSNFSEIFKSGTSGIIGSNSFSHRVSHLEEFPFMELRT